MKYKHIIWDYNGTILDDTDMVHSILNRMLKSRDLKTCTIDEYRDIFDFPIVEYYKKVGLDFEKYSFNELADEFTHHYEELFSTCKMRDGIVEMMEYFDSQNYTQSILTAGREKNIKVEIKDFGLSKYISEVTGLHNNKAESKVFLASKHLDKIKIKPSEILFIGDTTHDNLVAVEIGCDCILMAGGHQSEARLRAVNDKIAMTPWDIKKYI